MIKLSAQVHFCFLRLDNFIDEIIEKAGVLDGFCYMGSYIVKLFLKCGGDMKVSSTDN